MEMTYRSENGWFEVSIEYPQPLYRFENNMQIPFTLKIKNISGSAITRTAIVWYFSQKVEHYYRDPEMESYYGWSGITQYLHIGDPSAPFAVTDYTKAISWPNNAVLTYNVTSPKLDAGVDIAHLPYWSDSGSMAVFENDHGLVYDMSLVVYRNNSEDRFDDLSMSSTNPTIVKELWTPNATILIQRGLANGVPSDEGERLLITSRLGASEYVDTSVMYCRLYYEQNAPATTSSNYIDLTSSISTLLTGVTDDTSLVSQTFSNGSDWSFMLWFGDIYENATATASISRAFANLHLSGASTGGAAFGRFSSATERNPKLESEYPAYFYAGIEGVTNYIEDEVPTGGRWIDGKPVYRLVKTGTSTLTSGGQLTTLPSQVDTLIDMSLSLGNNRMANYTYFSNQNWDTNFYLSGQTVQVQAGSSMRSSWSWVFIMLYTRVQDPLPVVMPTVLYDAMIYDGSNTITPSVSQQSIPTAGYFMEHNLTVNEIPTSETPNDYGTTFTIGG